MQRHHYSLSASIIATFSLYIIHMTTMIGIQAYCTSALDTDRAMRSIFFRQKAWMRGPIRILEWSVAFGHELEAACSAWPGSYARQVRHVLVELFLSHEVTVNATMRIACPKDEC
jgi:hypothetical protein